MLAQLGFATGVLFFVPLGDIGDRRRLIVVMLVGAADQSRGGGVVAIAAMDCRGRCSSWARFR